MKPRQFGQKWQTVLKRRLAFLREGLKRGLAKGREGLRRCRAALPGWRKFLPVRRKAVSQQRAVIEVAPKRRRGGFAGNGVALKRWLRWIGIGLFDRGAVLSIGIIVGVVLAVSFWTEGKPFAGLINGDSGQRASVPAVAASAVSAPAQAQNSCTDGNFPFSQRVLSGVRANRPLQIGVFGDSFGDGIWAATNQFFQGDRSFAVYRFSQESTGFTRYQSLNLFEDIKAKVTQQPVDIALIDFGANDTQGILADGRALAYMSAGWQQLVGDRAGAIVRWLQEQGIAVAWIGLPRMRKESFDSDVQAMNAFYAGLACKLHVPFVNPVAVSEDNSHRFAIELTDPETGKPYLARADDGIHMSVHGYLVLARPLLQRIVILSAKNDPAGKES